MHHQSPVRSRARSEYFYARAVRVQLHTRVFLKFKSSCTVVVERNKTAISKPRKRLQLHQESNMKSSGVL